MSDMRRYLISSFQFYSGTWVASLYHTLKGSAFGLSQQTLCHVPQNPKFTLHCSNALKISLIKGDILVNVTTEPQF